MASDIETPYEIITDLNLNYFEFITAKTYVSKGISFYGDHYLLYLFTLTSH